MERKSGSKQKKQQEQDLINEYHKMVTEQALEPLYQSFLEWKPIFSIKRTRKSIRTLSSQVVENWSFWQR